MNKLILIIFFVLSCFSTKAQNVYGFSLNAGTALGLKSDLMETPLIGLQVSAGPRLNVFREKMYLKPTAGIRLLKEVKMEDCLMEISTLNLDLELLYRIGEYEGLQIYPFVYGGVNVSGFTLVYEDGSRTSSTGQLTRGFSSGLGAAFEYKSFQLKVQYDFFNSVSETDIESSFDRETTCNKVSPFSTNFALITLGYTVARR